MPVAGDDGAQEPRGALDHLGPDGGERPGVEHGGLWQHEEGVERLFQQVGAEVPVLARPPRSPKEGEGKAQRGSRAESRQALRGPPAGRRSRQNVPGLQSPGGPLLARRDWRGIEVIGGVGDRARVVAGLLPAVEGA